jgi:glucose-1-phosphate thymidylyltransferase
LLRNAVNTVRIDKKAAVFGYYVNDPERYGVCTFDASGNVTTIEEKPVHPKSNYAVVGLYYYPNSVIQTAKSIKPSVRGELEITTVNQCYLEKGELKVELMGRGFAWLDTGTHESLMEAGNFVETLEKRIGLKVACPEEIAFMNGWISKEQLIDLGNKLCKNQYGQYLLSLAAKS